MRILVYGAAGGLYGGIESFLLEMNRHMSDECVFDYVIVGDKCIHTEAIEAKGGKVYMVTSYKKNLFTFLKDSWQVAKNAKASHKTAYFNFFSMCHITAVLICKVMGYRIVLHAHNNNVPNKSKLYHLLHRFNRWLLRGMKVVRLTNSKASSAFMFGLKPNKENSVELIYNAIEIPKFQFDAEIRRKKRAELNVDGKTVFGFAGRLTAQKNPVFLAEIFAEIYKRDKNTVLLVAGEGNLQPPLEKTIEKLELGHCVKLLGNQRDIGQLYQAMDAFVFPSLFEGLGIVLVEAQAAGLRCFASADVIPSIVQISENILQFISLDASAEHWAQEILKGIAAPFERAPWSTVLQNSKFNIEREATRLERRLTCET